MHYSKDFFSGIGFCCSLWALERNDDLWKKNIVQNKPLHAKCWWLDNKIWIRTKSTYLKKYLTFKCVVFRWYSIRQGLTLGDTTPTPLSITQVFNIEVCVLFVGDTVSFNVWVCVLFVGDTVSDRVDSETRCQPSEAPSGRHPVHSCSLWNISVNMRINWTLGLGIVLGLIGASFLVAFGVLYVKPYMQVNTMISTTCTTWNVTVTDELVICTCASSDGGASCLSQYPCVKVWVNYTTIKGDLISNATLYDSHETFLLQRPVQQVGNVVICNCVLSF